MKKYLPLFLLLPVLSFLWPIVASAQLGTPSYVAQPGSRILSSEWNATVANIHDLALNRQGGTMTGTLTSQQITPSSNGTFDLGTALAKFRDFHFSRNGLIGGTLGVTGVLTAASFSGSGASLTSLPAGQLTGSIADARLSSNVPLLNVANVFTQKIQVPSTNTEGLQFGSDARFRWQSNRLELVNAAASNYETLYVLELATSGLQSVGGSAVRWGVNTAGDWTFGPSGNIAVSSGTPTIASGFGGGGSTIVGQDYAFFVTSAGGNTSGAVNFGHTWTNAPICVVTNNIPITGMFVTTSTTQLSLNYGSYSGSFYVICRGY